MLLRRHPNACPVGDHRLRFSLARGLRQRARVQTTKGRSASGASGGRRRCSRRLFVDSDSYSQNRYSRCFNFNHRLSAEERSLSSILLTKPNVCRTTKLGRRNFM
jgi:hypothetical protein